MLRIVLLSLLVIAVMTAVKDGRVLERAGLVGACAAVAAPEGHSGHWQACRSGKLEGSPDLTRKSCRRRFVVGKAEYWSCPTPLGGLNDAAARS